MNKRQYKKLVKRNALKIASLTAKEMNEFMEDFARGIKEGIESRMSEDKCVTLATHAVGLDNKKPYKRHGKYFYKPYRNHYAASPDDCIVWDEMVDKGWAKAGREDCIGGRLYWLTRKGLDWLGEKLEIKIHDEED